MHKLTAERAGTGGSPGSKTDLVRAVFEDVPRYLAVRQFDVVIRAETVRSIADSLTYERILDIGCGDGSISLPLLGPEKRITLLDLSQSMLAVAQAKVPQKLRDNVEVRNEDFMAASFPPSSFDLIICLGVMAHVESPEAFLAKISTLLKPGGSMILEFTDAFHFVGRVGRFLRSLKESIKPPRYAVNLLSAGRVFPLARRQGFRLVSKFRYALPPLPGIEMLSHMRRYRIVRSINGTCKDNRNAWWGNQYVCLLALDRTVTSE